MSGPQPCRSHRRRWLLSVPLPDGDAAFPSCARHVDEALIAAASEEEVFVAQSLDERPVHQHVDVFEQSLCGIVVQKVLVFHLHDVLSRPGVSHRGKRVEYELRI